MMTLPDASLATTVYAIPAATPPWNVVAGAPTASEAGTPLRISGKTTLLAPSTIVRYVADVGSSCESTAPVSPVPA